MFWIRPVLQNSPANNNDKRGKNKTGTNIFSIYSILNLVIDQINIHWQTIRSCWYKVLKPIVTYPYNNEISKKTSVTLLINPHTWDLAALLLGIYLIGYYQTIKKRELKFQKHDTPFLILNLFRNCAVIKFTLFFVSL